jgi:uncharacterized Zn finger protein
MGLTCSNLSRSDAIIRWINRSRARSVRLPAGEDFSRADVIVALADNRAITTLDLSEHEVCVL